MTDTSVKVLLCTVKTYILFIHTQKKVFEGLIFKGALYFQLICKFFQMNHEWTILEYDKARDRIKRDTVGIKVQLFVMYNVDR